MSNSMDLASLVAGKNTVDITHPKTGEPIGLKVTLRSSDAPEVKEVARKHLNDTLMLRGKTPSAEKVEARALDLMVASVESWEWAPGVTWGNEALECTPANVRRVLKDAPWIKRQLDVALGDEGAFFTS
jgi:hypothetical protein